MRGGERPPVALTLKMEGTSGKLPAKKTVTFKLDAPATSPIPRKSPKKGARQQKTASHDTKAHLAQRPYLSKPAVHLPTSPPVTSQPSQPTTTNRPTDEATIKWGKKLGGLDDGAIARLAK